MKILIPSYNRPGNVATLDFVPSAMVVVPESQRADYEKSYPGKVISIPDEKDGNVAKKRNAILDLLEEGEWAWILDDDLEIVYDLMTLKEYSGEVEKLLENVGVMADDLGVHMAGFMPRMKQALAWRYSPYTPFSLTKPMFQCMCLKKSIDLRYVEELVLHSDLDYWLQCMRKDRMSFRDNRYCLEFAININVTAERKKQVGGIERTEDMNKKARDAINRRWGKEMLESKWGNKTRMKIPVTGN